MIAVEICSDNSKSIDGSLTKTVCYSERSHRSCWTGRMIIGMKVLSSLLERLLLLF
jgi:hypothetical protein